MILDLIGMGVRENDRAAWRRKSGKAKQRILLKSSPHSNVCQRPHFGIAVWVQVFSARTQSAVTWAMSAWLHSPSVFLHAFVTMS